MHSQAARSAPPSPPAAAAAIVALKSCDLTARLQPSPSCRLPAAGASSEACNVRLRGCTLARDIPCNQQPSHSAPAKAMAGCWLTLVHSTFRFRKPLEMAHRYI